MHNSPLSNEVQDPAIAKPMCFHGCRKSLLSRILTRIFSKQCQHMNGYNLKHIVEISTYYVRLFLMEIYEASTIGNFSHDELLLPFFAFSLDTVT